MTQLADFVVIKSSPVATADGGKWTSEPFETGGRLTKIVNGVEQANAYVTLTLGLPQGVAAVGVRVIVNDKPHPDLVTMKPDSQRTAAVAFPASQLRDGSNNTLELHSQGEVSFFVFSAICHFRQNS